jgi:N utilization substance protein A
VTKVIVDEDNHSMEVIVADDQLSLSIGKRGQNVRLAAQLTGWRLDIKSEARLTSELVGTKELIASIPGLGMMRAEILVNEGIKTFAEVADMSPRTFVRLLNMNESEGAEVVEAAKALLASGAAAAPAKAPADDNEDFHANSSADPTRPEAPRSNTSNYDNARTQRIELFLELDGVGEATAHALADAGYGTIGDLMADAAEEVSSKSGLALSIARTVQMAADRYLQR